MLELGAQVIHGDRNPLRDRPHRWAPVPRSTAARAVLGGRLAPLGALARDGTAPWSLEERLAADGGSEAPVAGWLAAQRLPGAGYRVAAEWFRQNWAAEPEELSARGVALARRADAALGTGEFAFERGFAALAEGLAGGLNVRLGWVARSLTWRPGWVELAGGARVTGLAAVVTVPPPVIAGGRLGINPMPAGKAAAAAALRSGDGWCAVAVLSRPAPESAVVFDADGRGGFIRCAAGRPEVLVVAKAGAARRARRGSLAGLVARALPWSAGLEVATARVADWGRDPWSAGAFSYPAVGARWAGPAWAAPLGDTVFFAGEATTAGARPPSVHGALDSGLRAAREVLEALGR